jgi:uncharacterized protein YqeY
MPLVGRFRPVNTSNAKRTGSRAMRETLSAALKDAMKAQDKRRLSTLRLVTAALKDRDIEARGQGRERISDDEILALLQKMIKQRQESSTIYEQGGRQDLAAVEREEIDVIQAYLPKQLSEDETKAAIAAVIEATGAAGLRDMGKVMAELKARHTGSMDFAKASPWVKAALGA